MVKSVDKALQMYMEVSYAVILEKILPSLEYH